MLLVSNMILPAVFQKHRQPVDRQSIMAWGEILGVQEAKDPDAPPQGKTCRWIAGHCHTCTKHTDFRTRSIARDCTCKCPLTCKAVAKSRSLRSIRLRLTHPPRDTYLGESKWCGKGSADSLPSLSAFAVVARFWQVPPANPGSQGLQSLSYGR